MRKEVKDYARSVLAEHGCDEYTYGTTDGEQIISDLKHGYPDGMQFPYIDVANAIIAISKRKPIKRDTWSVIWSSDDCCDGFHSVSFAQAKQDTLDLLLNWMWQQSEEWDPEGPTEDQIIDWDYMIYNCSAYVAKYNPDTDEYDEYWEPSDKDLARIGWVTKGED